MKAEDIIYRILAEKEMYISKNYPINDLGCSISTKNARLILEYYKELIGFEPPLVASSILLGGVNIFPSDFVTDSQFIISEIKQF